MKTQGLNFFTLCFLLCIPLYLSASDSVSAKQLANEHYWHTLLHYRNAKSDIDDPSFFLYPKGNTNPYKELQATLTKIREHNQSILCKYPARIDWLKKKLPTLFSDYNQTTCNDLAFTLHKNDQYFVTLVFPMAHINSPASMFGHTFLRIDKDKNTPLISQAINFSAKTDETNGLLFAYKGLVGDYKGYYSALPYYKKIQEYSHLEKRDIWEYDLNLSQDEIRKLVYHLNELKGVYSNYYFFTKNCSYNLLWLLQVARDEQNIVTRFKYKAIPLDTIRILKKKGFIQSAHFRPSARKKIQRIIAYIDDIRSAKLFVHTYDIALLANLTERQKIYYLDLAIAFLKQEYSQRKIPKKKYTAILMKLLTHRSQCHQKPDYRQIVPPTNPLHGHKSARLMICVSSLDKYMIGIKPAFHDIYDIEEGFIEGAYIDFFNLKMQKYKEDDIRLEEFDFVSITSLSPRDRFFQPWSWQVGASIKRVHDQKIYFNFSVGRGITHKINDYLVYVMVSANVYLNKNILVSLAPKIGLLKNFYHTKIGFMLQNNYFSDGIQEQDIEAFVTYKFSKDVALNLKIDKDKIGVKHPKSASCALLYYF